MIGLTFGGGDYGDIAGGVFEQLRPRAEAAVLDSVLMAEGTAKEILSTPGRGRVYERGEWDVSFVARSKTLGGSVFSKKGRNLSVVSFTANRGKASNTHQASAPGDPPAPDTGDFRNKVTHTLPEWKGDVVSAQWGTNDERAPWFEHGTEDMAPRPWARPTEEQVRPTIEARLEQI